MYRTFITTVSVVVLALTGSACSQNSNTTTTTTTEGSTAPDAAGSPAVHEAGAITIAGSTALLPLVKQAASDYQAQHSDAKISVSGGGSLVGLTQAAQKGVDIGDSDIQATGQPSLIDHQVAVASFAVVVNPAAGLKNLTSQQIRDIFSGKVTNFKDVGGKDQQIAIVNRPRSSGTRAVFVKKIMNGVQPAEGGSTQDSSGTVASIVGQTPGAISYVSTSYVKNGNVVALSIDGNEPTAANVQNGKYAFWSYEHMYTNGAPSEAAAAFITFVTTDKPALDALGFIPVGAVKASK